MKNRAFHLLLLLFVAVVEADKKRLAVQRITEWGDWQGWQICPPRTFAAGIKHKIESRQGSGDDTGLNAIALYCFSPDWHDNNEKSEILAGEGQYGTWGAYRECNPGELIVGYSMRAERTRGGSFDDLAADNAAVYCGDPFGDRNKNHELKGDSADYGEWSNVAWCPTGYAVCAYNQQIEKPQGGGDDTSLNNIEMDCCNVEIYCEPRYEMAVIDEYDNRRGTGEVEYTYSREVSITNTHSSTSTLSSQEKSAVANKISATIGASGSGLSASLSAELSQSHEHTSTESLQQMVVNSAQVTETKSFKTRVPQGKKLTIKQVHFKCGKYLMRVPQTVLIAS